MSCEIALIWISVDFTDDQSTLVQVMAWCRQATSHYLSQCWPRSLTPYGITRPQWVNFNLELFWVTTFHCLTWMYLFIHALTHWGRVTHICVSKQTIISSDNGLSLGRHQSIISTNDGILLIGSLGTNFSEILKEIYTFSFKKIRLKMSSGKWRPFCLGLNVLIPMMVKLIFVSKSALHCCWYATATRRPSGNWSEPNKQRNIFPGSLV